MYGVSVKAVQSTQDPDICGGMRMRNMALIAIDKANVTKAMLRIVQPKPTVVC